MRNLISILVSFLVLIFVSTNSQAADTDKTPLNSIKLSEEFHDFELDTIYSTQSNRIVVLNILREGKLQPRKIYVYFHIGLIAPSYDSVYTKFSYSMYILKEDITVTLSSINQNDKRILHQEYLFIKQAATLANLRIR